jgi:hypothetical protein
MKPFKNMKVAVCLVGQSRTFVHCADSINKFFQSNKGNTFTFFGHTWDSNSYKVNRSSTPNIPDGNITVEEEQELHIPKLYADMNKLFKLERLIVEPDKNLNACLQWSSIFYSIMRANFLKQQYEAEHNMMFDLVITHRYDVCYRLGDLFENHINRPIEEKTLYSHYGLMQPEFLLPNPAQEYYFGTSLTMDLIDTFYHQLASGSFHKLVGQNTDNPAWNNVGPGALIHKWATIKNILPCHIQVPFAIYRKQSVEQELNFDADWGKCKQLGACIY